MRTALIVGVAGTQLSRDEAAFLQATRARAGFILFARNSQRHAQIRALIADVRAAVGADDLLVLIDQEGGRVQRLRPPLGRALPPAAAYGTLYARDHAAAAAGGVRGDAPAGRRSARRSASTPIARRCSTCPSPARTTSSATAPTAAAPTQVVALARAVGEGFMAGGVVPVIKHIPGHGRATADSHLALPVVDRDAAPSSTATDFAPFKALQSPAGGDDGARRLHAPSTPTRRPALAAS